MYGGNTIGEQTKIFFKLLIPVLIYQMISYSSNMIGTFMVGHHSPEELAGVSMGVNIWTPLFTSLNAIVMAIIPIVSQLLGSGKEKEISTKVRQFIYVAFFIGVILVILMNFAAKPLVVKLGLSQEVASVTETYLTYQSFAVVPIFIYVVLRAFMDSLGLTKLSMVMMIISIPINIFFAYSFIFGKFGFHEFGGVGNALATTVTYIILMFVAIAIVIKSKRINKYKIFIPEKIKLKYWPEIFKLGIPMGLAVALETVMFSALSMMVARFDTVTIAAHQSALNFSGFLYSLPLSISNALTIIVAYHVGAKNYSMARKYTLIGTILGLITSVLTGIFVFLLNNQIPKLYGSNAEVIKMTANLLLFAIGFAISDSFSSALAGVLRAYKKVIPICVCMTVGYYFIGIPICYYLVFNQGKGVEALWIGWIIGLFFYSVFIVIYYIAMIKKIQKGVTAIK